jgi:plasmid stabilization system protein ParE
VKPRVAYTEAAQEERREAVAFYRAASLDIARSFQREFKHEIALLKERPWIGAPYEGGTRRKVFPYFPYSLIYTFRDDLITIYAVKHHSRDPGYWLDRVESRRR